MTEKVYMLGPDRLNEDDLNDVVSEFVNHAVATSNVMWAASCFDEVDMSEDIGKVASNLHLEALYVRRRLKREVDERIERQAHWDNLRSMIGSRLVQSTIVVPVIGYVILFGAEFQNYLRLVFDPELTSPIVSPRLYLQTGSPL